MGSHCIYMTDCVVSQGRRPTQWENKGPQNKLSRQGLLGRTLALVRGITGGNGDIDGHVTRKMPVPARLCAGMRGDANIWLLQFAPPCARIRQRAALATKVEPH